MDFDAEPLPISQVRASIDLPTDWPVVTKWPRTPAPPNVEFWSVLNQRRSDIGESAPNIRVQSLLRHATMLRARSQTGRFGTWESRSAPSPGGLHAIRILVLPVEQASHAGIYDDKMHGLRAAQNMPEAVAVNRQNIMEILDIQHGTTLQLIADCHVYTSCYKNPESLIWREAGALAMTIALCATALSLSSTPVGSHGSKTLRALGLSSNWNGVGSVHITSARTSSSA